MRSEAPSVLSAPDLCVWASGPEQRSELKKNNAAVLQKTVT